MSIKDLDNILAGYDSAVELVQQRENEKKEAEDKLLEEFKVFKKDHIKPIMEQYENKLKEYGHDCKIIDKVDSIEIQILPNIIKRESYRPSSHDKNAHAGFYYNSNKINTSSSTIVPGFSSGSGGVRKSFKSVEDISEKEINVLLTSVITEIFDNCKMAIGWK